MIRENQSFDLPDVLYLNNEHRDDLLDAIKEIKELQNNIYGYDERARRARQKLQLKKKFLQKRVDEYNRLNPTFEISFTEAKIP